MFEIVRLISYFKGVAFFQAGIRQICQVEWVLISWRERAGPAFLGKNTRSYI